MYFSPPHYICLHWYILVQWKIFKYKDRQSQATWDVFIFSGKISAPLTEWNCSRLHESRLGKMTTIFFCYQALKVYLTVTSLDRMHATIRPFRHRLIKKWAYGVTIASVWGKTVMLSTATFVIRQRYGEWWLYSYYVWKSFIYLMCQLVI